MAHCDLKPDNIVINNDYSLSLIDFGHAKNLRTLISRPTGTGNYMAPEVRRSL